MKSIFLILILISSFSLFSQPKWIDSQWRKAQYPDATYLVGFASESNKTKQNENELLRKLEGFAKSQLSESIIVTINSMMDYSITEANDQVSQYVRKNCSTTSNMELAGLKTETYYNKKSKTAYVIAYAKKEDVCGLYRNKINEKIGAIKIKITSAEKYQSTGDNANALKTYYSTYQLFRETEEAQTIYLALKHNLSDEASGINELTALKLKVDQGIVLIQNSKNNSIEDACFLLANAMQIQTNKISDNIRLLNFTYQDTKMGSSFTRRFANGFEQKLISDGGYSISNEGVYQDISCKYMISGTYWEEGDCLRIISVMRDMSGKAVASAESLISIALLDSLKIAYKPENFNEAYSNMQVFKKNEVIPGNLNAKIWTNKGDENLIFSEGERMRLFVRVNKECYVRFVYYLADGSRVLLLDNYYIDAEKVNKVYELPYEFVCSEPFGVEVLQLNVQTEKFPALKIARFDGYDYIEEPLADVIQKNRGMKRADSDLMQAEKRIIITTMK